MIFELIANNDYKYIMVRVLFHISISRISIYTKRAISAQLAMFHVMEFYLWPNLVRRNILKNEK